MKYSKPNCPECGEVLAGECDYIPARARVYRLEDGSFDYTGDTEEFWDGQSNEIEIERHILTRAGHKPPKSSKIRVECYKGHQWETRRSQ